MIPYYGTPITPMIVAIKLLTGRHAFVSFANPQDIHTAAAVCQSFALDNGAFPCWKSGTPTNWPAYYEWCREWLSHPGCDWAVIPDVIDGDEEANDALIAAWPFGHRGVPVWHMHERLERLIGLVRMWPRVAIGSSAEYATVGNAKWLDRMNEAMCYIVGSDMRPVCKLHGLRMLNPKIFEQLPLASADSTNIARNVGLDTRWRGAYMPKDRATRALVMADRVEQFNSSDRWNP